MTLTPSVYRNFVAARQCYRELAGAVAPGRFDTSAWWFETQAETCLDPDDEVVCVAAEAAGGPRAALMLRRRGRPGLLAGARELASLSSPYTCSYQPLIAPGVARDAALTGLAAGLVQAARQVDVVNLEALPEADDLPRALARALGRAGFLTRRYRHFGNWYDRVADLDAAAFLAARPSALRNTLRRRAKRLAALGGVTFQVLTDAADAAAGIAAYERVYAASWKGPEPHPDFAPALIRGAAAAGALRLGLCLVDGVPAAAQIWLVGGGGATIFKLAYDEAHKDKSLGTVLTGHMVDHVMTRDGVTEIDFGRGDDAYKADWLPRRREHWGVLGFNPRRPLGLAAACRHGLVPWLRDRLRRDAAADQPR